MLRAGTGEIEAGREDFVEGREKRNADTHEGWTSNVQRSFNAKVLMANSQIEPHQVTYDAVAWPMHIQKA
eukprot:scaffold12176_cov144-Skeletonema_marinoi.AAC.1